MAQDIEQRLGVHAARGAYGSEPFAIPLDGTTLIPPRATLVHPEQWVAAAVQQKLAKYGPMPDVVLVVHLHSPDDLERSQLEWLRRWHDTHGSPFREVWVVNDYGTPAQRVPT